MNSNALAKAEVKEVSVPDQPDLSPRERKLEFRRVACHLTESLFQRMLRKVFPDERKEVRHAQPPLVCYIGLVHSTKPYDLADISLSGFCLLTEERWIPGTEMPVTLQRTGMPGEAEAENFTVQATVVRCYDGGVGFSIVLSEDDSDAAYGNPLNVRWLKKQEMESFLKGLTQQSETGDQADGGQARAAGLHVAGGRLTPASEVGR